MDTHEPLPEPPSTPLNIQDQSPFLQSLIHEKALDPLSFHMPGHKFSAGMNPLLSAYWGDEVYPADRVEVGGIIDYLHAPRHTLVEAQRLAALAVGADHSFFLVNGSTVGNLASMMATVSDGQKVIMPRASHRSVYGGLILSGAEPVYIPPVYHPQVEFPLAVSVQVVADMLAAHPDARAVQITSPNYYGFLSDTAAIANLAHAHGIPLLVDEAHGAHLAYHPALPRSAVALGADLIVQSMHKTLGALTQSAILHLNGSLVNHALLQQVLTLLQSSSPNSLLVASLDAARQQMAVHGAELLQPALDAAQTARQQIRAIPGLWCYGDELIGQDGVYAYDPTKLVIRVSETGLSGSAFMRRLRQEHNVEPEFASPKHLICSISFADNHSSLDRLIEALRAVAASAPHAHVNGTGVTVAPPALPRLALSPRQAYFARSKRVPVAQAVGEICAENVIPYPPGIPLLMPGEVIDADTLDYLRFMLDNRISIVGPEDLNLEHIRVISGD